MYSNNKGSDEEVRRATIPVYGATTVTPVPVVIDGDHVPLVHVNKVAVSDESSDEEVSRPVYRDIVFSILFLLHLVVIGILAMLYGSFQPPDGIDFNVTHWRDFMDDDARKNTDEKMSEEDWQQLQIVVYEVESYLRVYPCRILLFLVIPSSALAFMASFFANTFVIPSCPKAIVTSCLLLSFGWTVLIVVGVSVASHSWLSVLISGGVIFLVAYYIRAVFRMIPFAAVNLEVALQGINANAGMYVVAIAVSILGFAWTVLWLYTLLGVSKADDQLWMKRHAEELELEGKTFESDQSPWAFFRFFLFLVSLYWTNTVLLNTIQVTVAGVMGTWCYVQDEARSWCSPAVTSSLSRSVTYSFGSICMGSLLQAIITALRQLLENARRSQRENRGSAGGALLLCLLECLMRCLEDVIDYFSQWAYVYVGIYGYSYLESGRKVVELFKARGWTAFVTNDLVSYVLGFTSVSVGLVTGGLSMLVEYFINKAYPVTEGSFTFGPLPCPEWWAFALGVYMGIGVCSVMMNVVKGGVNTLIVCYADGPERLEDNHPEATRKMAEAWSSVFPELVREPQFSVIV